MVLERVRPRLPLLKQMSEIKQLEILVLDFLAEKFKPKPLKAKLSALMKAINGSFNLAANAIRQRDFLEHSVKPYRIPNQRLCQAYVSFISAIVVCWNCWRRRWWKPRTWEQFKILPRNLREVNNAALTRRYLPIESRAFNDYLEFLVAIKYLVMAYCLSIGNLLGAYIFSWFWSASRKM